MIDFSKVLRFRAGSVLKVLGEDGRVRLDAGATMTPEETLELAETLLHARRVMVGGTPGPDTDEEATP